MRNKRLNRLLRECGECACESGVKVADDWDHLLPYILKHKLSRIGFDLGNVIIDKSHSPDGKTITWKTSGYKDTPGVKGAYEGIAKLSNGGAKLFIIGRGDEESGEDVKSLNWLTHNGFSNFFNPRHIIIVRTPDEKNSILSQLGLDVFVDDRTDLAHGITNTETVPGPSVDIEMPLDETVNTFHGLRIFLKK